ncbi:MAG: proteasome assembly chaperone family protein [Candidatus Methanofastidiosia archaeon]
MTEVIEKVKLEYKNAVAIEGFPGVGLVGHIAATYIIHSLKLSEVGYMCSDTIPPVSLVFEGKVLPPLRVYAKENLIVFICDIPLPDESIYEITKTIGNFLKEKGVKMSYSLAGIGIGETGENVYVAASEKKFLEDVEEKELKILQMGTISGASGSLLSECIKQDIPALGLLAETVGNVPDPRASANLIKRISELLDLKIDVSPLLKEAELVEARYKKLSEDMERTKRKEAPTMYL